jgi:hypothetical protein
MFAVVWTVFSFKRNVLGTLTLRLILAPVRGTYWVYRFTLGQKLNV